MTFIAAFGVSEDRKQESGIQPVLRSAETVAAPVSDRASSRPWQVETAMWLGSPVTLTFSFGAREDRKHESDIQPALRSAETGPAPETEPAVTLCTSKWQSERDPQ